MPSPGLTQQQQLEYDVFIRNNPGDEGRASSALGFDVPPGTQVWSANDDPGNWDVAAARGEEAPGVSQMIESGRSTWERMLREESARKRVSYDPTMLEDVIRAVSHSSNVGKDPGVFLQNAFRTIGQRAANTPGGVQPSPTTTGGASGAGSGAQSGGSNYGAMMDVSGMGGDFGAAPEPFGETYTPLARPSYLQGEYVPEQWGETFTAPEKPGVLQAPFALPAKPTALQTPYALPTQADLEASPGYLAGSDAMQRGMERSAAAKGSILSGGFVGRALPRALGEYAGSAYGNLVGQTLGARQQQVGEYTGDVNAAFGARQQQYGEYSGDVSNAFQQYMQRYGQFADAQGLKLGARNVNESAFQADEGANLGGFKTRYGQYLDQAGLKRQAENDLWSRNRDLSDLSLRAAALARP